jgi:hypothetical protein
MITFQLLSGHRRNWMSVMFTSGGVAYLALVPSYPSLGGSEWIEWMGDMSEKDAAPFVCWPRPGCASRMPCISLGVWTHSYDSRTEPLVKAEAGRSQSCSYISIVPVFNQEAIPSGDYSRVTLRCTVRHVNGGTSIRSSYSRIPRTLCFMRFEVHRWPMMRLLACDV